MTRFALVLFLLGCGNEPKAPDPAAPPSATPATTAPATAAPTSMAKPLKAQLIGSWRVDLDYIKTDAEMLALPPEQRKKAMEMARTILKDLRIEFGADGSVKVGAGEKMNAGTYTVTPTGADTLSIDAKMTSPNGAEQTEVLTVQFVAGKIMVTGPDGKATRFMK